MSRLGVLVVTASLFALPVTAQSVFEEEPDTTPVTVTTPGLGELMSRAGEAEASAETEPEFVIGVGDVIGIDVWQEPNVSAASVTVRSDGKISIPLAREVSVAGLKPMQLEDLLAERLREYINNPVVTVIVREVRSQRVYLVGGVARPGMVQLEPGLTAVKAIGVAGGLTDYAKRKKIFVLRQVGEEVVQLPLDYPAVLSGKNPSADVVLRSGDTIVVPE
jgi:polysaccharide biosynthesis/export protein